MRNFIIAVLIGVAACFLVLDVSAQGKGGFLQMDPNQKKSKKNQYITIKNQRDTIKLYDQHGNYRKDTVVTNDNKVKHGVWIETDSAGNRLRRRYKRGELVEEEQY